jgi:hypothetical protein
MVLSLVLIVILSLAEIHLTSFGAMAISTGEAGREARSVAPGSDPIALLRQSGVRRDFLYQPLIAVMVGLCVGLFSRKSRTAVAVMAMAPFSVLVVDSNPDLLIGLGWAAGYVLLSLAVAHAVGRIRPSRQRATATAATGPGGA